MHTIKLGFDAIWLENFKFDPRFLFLFLDFNERKKKRSEPKKQWAYKKKQIGTSKMK